MPWNWGFVKIFALHKKQNEFWVSAKMSPFFVSVSFVHGVFSFYSRMIFFRYWIFLHYDTQTYKISKTEDGFSFNSLVCRVFVCVFAKANTCHSKIKEERGQINTCHIQTKEHVMRFFKSSSHKFFKFSVIKSDFLLRNHELSLVWVCRRTNGNHKAKLYDNINHFVPLLSKWTAAVASACAILHFCSVDEWKWVLYTLFYFLFGRLTFSTLLFWIYYASQEEEEESQ